MKILMAAGGTGGHIYPAIAVANEMMRRDAANEVRFVGTARGLETKLVPDAGFKLETIESAGIKNVGLAGTIKGLLLLPKSFLAARALIKKFEPDVVVGAGGYVTGSVLLMASLMKIPTLVMESNALPGFTNRQLARFIDKAAVTFPEAAKFFPGNKAVVTGNPVRKEFFDIQPKARENERFCLLAFGGSQGARAINQALVAALPFLDAEKNRLQIVHQTGEPDFETVNKDYQDASWFEENSPATTITRYISDMNAEFGKADLIVCRAGATTCAELAASGKAAIMVPLPTAADDHQRKNAEALQDVGAAKMILQKDLTGEVLAKEIKNLIIAPEKITAMEQAAKSLVKGDAAAKMADLIEQLAVDSHRSTK